MDEQEQTEEEWSGYCVKHRDDILRMMIDVARLLFGNRPARELPTVFKPPFGKSELFSLESDDVQIECDELIAGFPESSRTLEPVHAAMEGISPDVWSALYRRLAWNYCRYTQVSLGRYIIRADAAFLLHDLFLMDGRIPPVMGFVDGDDWPIELQRKTS